MKEHNSLNRAIDILEYIANANEGMTLDSISNALAVPKSSICPLLNTLEKRKYLHKSNNKVYTLGIKNFEIGSKYIENGDLSSRIRYILDKISTEAMNTVHFGILDGTDVVYLYKVEGKNPIKMSSSIGKRLPAHATALGKALLSQYSDNELKQIYPNEILEKRTVNTISSREELIRQINKVRITNFSYEIEESTENIKCLSCPIRNRNGVIASISISIPILKSEDRFDLYEGIIKSGAKELEELLYNANFINGVISM